ncbi:hypothetical protein C1H46_028376 [Malus baccata]|uniref:Uncharacterized protein n=1 Tax=Malus baccata TaxID=106549 RepID=A0A540LHW5_MALBA|nr:hypothetical protein C1H46_028376 [Malus baccata]
MDPPPRSSCLFFRRIILPFLHAWVVLRRSFLSRPNTENEWPERTLPITVRILPPPPHPHFLPRPQYSQASDRLRGYRSNNHTCNILFVQIINTNTDTNPADYMSLGKTILSLSFQTVVALALPSQSSPSSSSSSSSTTTTNRAGQAEESQPPHSLLFHILGVVMAFAFAGSFSGIVQRVRGNHRAATILENTGYVSAVIGFFLIINIFLPGVFAWICWLACAFTLLCFGLQFIG